MSLELKTRELEILRLLNGGKKNQEIATYLHLSVQTIKWYLRRIYNKLQVGNRKEAVVAAGQLGLLDITTASLHHPAYLPRLSTPFFGRIDPLQQLTTLLNNPTARLITVHGLGGIGKTRLAIEAARQTQEQFPDGVYFVTLNSVQTEDELWQSIAQFLSIDLDERYAPFEGLVYTLQKWNALLILDGFEPLIRFAPCLSHLLWQTQQMKLLVTSRRWLALHSETIFALHEFQDEEAAIALFLTVARRKQINFSPTEQDYSAIRALCRSISHIPLAIELAAMWINLFTPQQLADKLGKGHQLLISTDTPTSKASQGMVEILDDSWRRLSPCARSVAYRLSAVDGAFSAENAQTTPLILRELLESNLLQRKQNGLFRMTRLIRQDIQARFT